MIIVYIFTNLDFREIINHFIKFHPENAVITIFMFQLGFKFRGPFIWFIAPFPVPFAWTMWISKFDQYTFFTFFILNCYTFHQAIWMRGFQSKLFHQNLFLVVHFSNACSHWVFLCSCFLKTLNQPRFISIVIITWCSC